MSNSSDTNKNDSFIAVFPITAVHKIKISSNLYKSITKNGVITTTTARERLQQAIAYMNSMDGEDIMMTDYSSEDTDAQYFLNEGGSNIYTVYRRSPDDAYYKYLFTMKNGVLTINDYNIKSGHYYHYMMTLEQQQVNSKTGEKVISYEAYEMADSLGGDNYYRPKFSNWTICNVELTTDSSGTLYTKTGHTWRLGLNMEGESITKNLNINTQDTLSRYPKITIGQKNYDTMQFSSLLGNMYEYDDYEYEGETNTDEQARLSLQYPKTRYQYTEKLDSYDSDGTYGIYNKYSTESDKLEAWREFITDGELKLIKDMKGNSWVAQISDSSEYKIDTTSNLMQTQISFTWTEVMDVDEISIITEEG